MPASRPSSDYPGRSPSRQPEVPRPQGSIAAAIEQEGISWEGQVLVVGPDGDIAARLIVTTDRFLITHRDDVLLEAPRTWLMPAPIVVADNGVRFSITPDGVVPGRDTTERIQLRIRDGRGPAVQLVAILTGRSRATQQSEAEFPSWNSGVGAGRSSALPPLPAFETRQDAPPTKWPTTDDPETRGVAPLTDWGDRAPERRATSPSLRAPDPEPVDTTSRAARFLVQRPVVVSPDDAAEAERTSGAAVTSLDEERTKRGAGWLVWTSRVAVLALVILAAAWFGREYLPEPVTRQLPAFVTTDLASNPDGSEPELDTTVENGDGTDGTDGADSNPQDIMPTEAALGVGGATTSVPDGEGESTGPAGEIPTPTPPAGDTGGATNDSGTGDDPAESGGSDQADTGNDQEQVPADAEQEPVPTEPVIVVTPDAPQPTAPVSEETVVVEPTAPVDETVVVETPEPTVPVDETIVVETPEPTVAPSETVIAETPGPTIEAPPAGTSNVVETPEATAPVDDMDDTLETAPSEPTLEPQAPSVNPDNPPAQVFADQGFRYSIEGAATGNSLEELPQVADVAYGEWVVLAVNGTNWTDSEQVFDMTRFTLMADGEPIQLDVGNSWVASLLNYTPAYGNTDAILWAPGEEHQFVLTFLAPNDAQSLALVAGDQRFDLTSVLSKSQGLMATSQGTAPEMTDAMVVDVVDGETIVIEKDGIQQTVRYLGIDVPDEDECYFAESTEANRTLVEGRSVKIERQATNVDAQGNWVRDVWVQNDEGTYVLVAHQLVQQSAAEADISEPNTRFTGWLRGAEAVAQAQGLGLWGACGSADQASALASVPRTDAVRRITLLA